MSEDIELKYKARLLRDYKENGGVEDISALNIDLMEIKVDSQREIFKLKKENEELKKKPEPKKDPIKGVDGSKENATAVEQSKAIWDVFEQLFPPQYEPHELLDECYKKDNELLKWQGKSVDQRDTVILRGIDGRLI